MDQQKKSDAADATPTGKLPWQRPELTVGALAGAAQTGGSNTDGNTSS